MIIYDIFFFLFSLAYLPYLIVKGKAHRRFAERFGILPAAFREAGAQNPVWIHAVSVGEVMAVKNFVKHLSDKFPGRRIVLSTTTKTGNEIAEETLGRDILKFYFPLDFKFTVKRALNIINPSLFIIMETEIWPNLILELSRRKVPVALINGRISERSFNGYKKIKFLFSGVLKKIDLFCMQTEKDAQRIEALGSPAARIRVTGNMKFDIGAGPDRPGSSGAAGMIPGVNERDALLIAGSTHRGEEEILLDAYSKLAGEIPDLKFLMAPRHVDRAIAIKKMAEEKGLGAALLSELKKDTNNYAASGKSVLILDTMGKLGRLYSLASVVFMGGSLIKKGGHNLVEPARFGKPIVFGRYMFNFRDMARIFLEENAAVEVKDAKELPAALRTLLKDNDKREALGAKARELIEKQRGATAKNINEVAHILGKER